MDKKLYRSTEVYRMELLDGKEGEPITVNLPSINSPIKAKKSVVALMGVEGMKEDDGILSMNGRFSVTELIAMHSSISDMIANEVAMKVKNNPLAAIELMAALRKRDGK